MKAKFICIFILYLGMNTCSNGIEVDTDLTRNSNKSTDIETHNNDIEIEVNVRSNKLIQTQVLVPDIDTFYCENDRDCSNGWSLTSKLVCQEDHSCACVDSCLTYTYNVYGIHAFFEFHCGECGQLGSECEVTSDCEYPGICSRKDHYCHCPVGEHKENVCILFDTHFLGSMLVFGFGIFVITILCGCAYQCVIGHRLYGNWRWWQNIPNWRRQRQAPIVMGPEKSPAFTATNNMWNRNHQNSLETSTESYWEYLPSTSSGIRHSSRRSTMSRSTINKSIVSVIKAGEATNSQAEVKIDTDGTSSVDSNPIQLPTPSTSRTKNEDTYL